ncbi:MAG: hypothetical protein ACLPZR_29625 [Solirubrobacteraceae bacterium]
MRASRTGGWPGSHHRRNDAAIIERDGGQYAWQLLIRARQNCGLSIPYGTRLSFRGSVRSAFLGYATAS